MGGEVFGTVVGCRERVVEGGGCQWRREAWWDQKVEGEVRERAWARSWGCWGWPSGWEGGSSEGGLGDMLGVTRCRKWVCGGGMWVCSDSGCRRRFNGGRPGTSGLMWGSAPPRMVRGAAGVGTDCAGCSGQTTPVVRVCALEAAGHSARKTPADRQSDASSAPTDHLNGAHLASVSQSNAPCVGADPDRLAVERWRCVGLTVGMIRFEIRFWEI